MVRPYMSWSVDKLEALFESKSGAPEVVSQIKEELSFRTTKRAQRLLEQVNQNLAPKGAEVPTEHETDGEVAEPDKENDEFEEEADQEVDQPFGSGTQQEMPDALNNATSNGDQPPDDRNRPQTLSQIRPLGTGGLPQPWIRPLDQDLTLRLPSDADVPQIYCAALAALIAEIKKTGSGQKRYELERGVRVEGMAGEFFYEFCFTDEADLFEDAKVEVELPGRCIDGSIVSISSGRLLLATKEDLGPVLHRAVIVIDATALLEALRDKVEQAGKGEIPINRELADAVVGEATHPARPSPIPRAASPDTLDSAQSKAVQKALTESVTYIWGPPGTGKTHVLGDVVRWAFENGKRVLICSNTNKAVDQVLVKICNSLGIHHPAMEEGSIVRLGSITLDVLRSKYEQYVTVDGIVERKSVDLKARSIRLQDDIARIDARTASARNILSSFAEFETAQTAVEFHKEATNTVARSVKELKAKHETIRSRIAKLEGELAKPKTGILGWFSRNEQAIKKDLAQDEGRLTAASAELDRTKSSFTEAKQRFEITTQERDRIEQQLAGSDRVAAEREIAQFDSMRVPLVEKLREIEAKLADIRAAVLKGAKVLGATCTKTYLAAREVGQVDMVIVDEASMVLLPMIWFAAGRARERVVVCGDFRQIPPIVQTRAQAIFDVLGRDVFAAAGLEGPSEGDTPILKLDRQYRMHDDICQLISRPMYGGLKTVTHPRKSTSPPPPYNHTLTIIDTSDLWPFESVNAYFSRFNLMHALLIRNLAWHFRKRHYIQEQGDLAICTPYAAQAKLIRKLVENEDFGDLVQVGTVHSFQGDERKAVVLELPEGYGGARMVGQFLQGVPPGHVGARLINVAVSRAKNHFIVLANLTYLDQLLPSFALLRGILYDMQKKGSVIRGSDLLALRPIESDLRGILGHVQLDLDAETLGLFDGPSFDRAVKVDIARAKDSVVVFSGFVTPGRVAKIGDLLRLKVAEGVKIRCVTRPPHLNGTLDAALGQQALDMLENIGCVIDGRARIHQKVVLIDREIVWHGSLNVLSHNHRTDESMTRVVNAGFAQAVVTNMSKRHISNDVALQTVANAENPRCGQCGHRTYYDEGKFGPYFRCEKTCGWTSSLKTTERGGTRGVSSRDRNLPPHGPPCPICKSQTCLRTGRFGPFYGCSKYPACFGKCQLQVGNANTARRPSSTRSPA